MRILLLADSNSPHTIRWAKSLRNFQNTIGIFTLHFSDQNYYHDMPDIQVISLNFSRELQARKETNIKKISYVKALVKIRRIIKEFKPDIVHAHYASSYGFIGALSGFHPFVLSIWGSDVFRFPNYSILHRKLFKFNLAKADKILSTSHIMKEETKKYTKKNIIVTPFGIDTEKFFPIKTIENFQEKDFVVGTIKSLETNYGIEYLIYAFKIVRDKFPEKSLKLLIVGGGSQKHNYENLIQKLDLDKDTTLTGPINHEQIQEYHNMLDTYVAMSVQESFGVAILEASACGKPVIVSKVGGLPEVVEDGKTGFIVESGDYKSLAKALSKLICEPNLRNEMGRNGRNKVLREFNWNDCVKRMNSIYCELVN